MLTLGWIVAAAALLQQPAPEAVEDLVALLESDDPTIVATARRDLVAMGRAAVPAIEAALRRRGALSHHLALLDIFRLEAAGSDDPRWIDEAKFFARLEDAPPSPADRKGYAQARFEEACKLYREDQGDAAARIAEGLLLLEPDCPDAADIRQLKALCDQRRLRATTVAARVDPEKKAAAVGDPVKLRFRIENRAKEEMRLDFGLGTGLIVVEIVVTLREPRGTEVVCTRAASIAVTKDLTLAPGEEKSWTLALDTSEDFPAADFIRTYEIHAWLQPYRLWVGRESTATRIVFVPARLPVVPASQREFLADPKRSFHEAVDSDQMTMNDVFTCAMLLEGPEKEEAAGVLIRLLKDMAKDPAGTAMTCYLLRFMTDREFGADRARWERWWAQRHPERTP